MLNIKTTEKNKYWVTSDWHFFHDRDFIYGKRGFKNVTEMTNTLVDRFNEVVQPDDIVFFLGDAFLGAVDEHKIRYTLNRLHCEKIYFIIGNHDTDKKLKMIKKIPKVEILGYAETIKYNGYSIHLSHYPTLCSNYDDGKSLKRKTFNICGHYHTQNKFEDKDKGVIYHAEVDAHNGYPVSIDKVIADLQKDI